MTAITSLYELYYNVVCDGRFIFRIEKMHKKYDPDFYDEIYTSSVRKRDKEPTFVPTFGVPYAAVATVKHDVHRYRRSLLYEFFSRRSVSRLSPVIEERVGKLMSRLVEFHVGGEVVDLCGAFGALTSDVITFCCYGKSWGFLEDPDFRSDIRTAANDFAGVPPQVMAVLMPGKSALFEFQRSIFEHFSAVVAGQRITLTGGGGITIIKRLTSEAIPPSERTLSRLQDEGFTLIVAGTETTMRSFAFAANYIFQGYMVRERLRAELRQVLPTPTSTATWEELEKLPYLTAVDNESLRLSNAAVIRLPRVAPNEYEPSLQTPMSTSIYFVHHNPVISPDPHNFNPERWFKASEDFNLRKYLVPFTKGSRKCVGVNLVIMEIYLTVATYVRRFVLEIQSVDPGNIRVARDRVVGFPETGTLQICAKVKSTIQF
ncbi:hypothetical protein PENANT_c056G11126 [Penicillium antarcticum]|uniref:Cytochrome P450 n=1 Tax=Penicillium antarcticum TaxID=416450 RepID=A0A1V6PQQ7_9EURO|nr:hypothetical protein PENANT_c056G11126 [Penicillium antarcticum]